MDPVAPDVGAVATAANEAATLVCRFLSNVAQADHRTDVPRLRWAHRECCVCRAVRRGQNLPSYSTRRDRDRSTTLGPASSLRAHHSVNSLENSPSERTCVAAHRPEISQNVPDFSTPSRIPCCALGSPPHLCGDLSLRKSNLCRHRLYGILTGIKLIAIKT